MAEGETEGQRKKRNSEIQEGRNEVRKEGRKEKR